MAVRILPTFRGYTVDVRLRQFRKVDIENCIIEFIDFDSLEGDQLLDDWFEKKGEEATAEFMRVGRV